MQSVVCQQAAQTYAKPAPNGATNVRGRTLRVPEGVSLPLRTIGNDTLRRFITDVRKAYRRVCADTRHLWPIHISISKDIRTIHSGSCTDVWTDDTDAGIAVRTCRNTDMEVCRYEDMEAYGRISAKRCSRTETGRRSHKGTNPQGFTYTVKHFNISMLMEKEPVYLAFSTQKGGAGKTTLTVLFASYLHYVKGYDVAVVDCDYPQHSIAGMRQRDLKLALEDNHYKALAYEQFTRLGKKAYPVVESSTERAIDDAERITGQAAFDLVFFDLPGTVNNPSVIRALSNMDYIIAPISADRVVLESTLRYMTVVNDVIRKTGVSNIKGTYLVWNMVDGREKSELYEVYEQVIAELGLHVLKTFIPDSKRFRRELSAGHRPLFRSTLFPADRSLLRGSNIEALTDEVLTLLNLRDNG